MSYAFSWALQKALVAAMAADPSLRSLIGDPGVYDEPPHGGARPLEAPVIVLGEEEVAPWGTQTDSGAVHRFTLSVHSGARGYRQAKRIAGALSDLLDDNALTLERGRIVALRFLRGRAFREAQGARRRIELTFRALIESTPRTTQSPSAANDGA